MQSWKCLALSSNVNIVREGEKKGRGAGSRPRTGGFDLTELSSWAALSRAGPLEDKVFTLKTPWSSPASR